jgi:transposase-like protein
MDRDLAEVDYVYVWADGIHLNVRLEEVKACVLVLVAVRADGSTELVALKDGYRESAESWADLMRDCARRGMRPSPGGRGRCPGLLEGPGRGVPRRLRAKVLGHRMANVLDSMPKSAQPGAKKAIQDIYNAEDRDHAEVAVKTKVTRGAGFRTATLAMVFKLVESAQQRWRAVNAPHLVALVRAGARFERGPLVERSESHAA